MKYLLTNIKWDLDCLPSVLEVEAEDEDHAVDVASDRFGVCIAEADIDEDEEK